MAAMTRGAIIAGLVLAAAAAAAQPVGIAVTGAFARATAPGQEVGGVFLTITSRQGDTLVGATSDAARAVSVHRMSMAGGMMTMEAVGALKLPPGQPVSLLPGRMHLMLEGLRAPLLRGHVVHVTLLLAEAGRVTVDVPVAGPGAAGPEQAAPGHAP